jgi:hypothetical protein
MGGRRTVVVGCALVILVGLFSFPRLLLGSDQTRVKEMIQNNAPDVTAWKGKRIRVSKKAPDLIGAGQQISALEWLLRYLTGKEAAALSKRISLGFV